MYALGSLAIIYTAGNLILKDKSEINFHENIKDIIPYVITALFPIIWFVVLKEHSYVHSFFTYRILIITIISIFIIIRNLFEIKDEKCQN